MLLVKQSENFQPMRKYFTIFAVLSVLIFSCNVEEQASNDDSSAIQMRQNELQKEVLSLFKNETYKTTVFNHFDKTKSKSGNQGNGILVIKNNLSIFNAFDIGDNKMLFVGGDFDGSTISIMPNGYARFKNKSDHPFCFILDFNTFTSTYSNDFYDERAGSYFSNFVSDYEEFSPIPGLTFYFPGTDIQTSSVLKMNTLINNAQPILNEFWELIGVTEPTEELSVSVNLVEAKGKQPVVKVQVN